MVPERISGPADLCRQRQYLGEVAASRGFRGRPIAGPANWELPLTGPALHSRPRIVASRHIADCHELLVDPDPQWPVVGNAAVPALGGSLDHFWLNARH